jgi:hypothetical protein
VGTGGAALAGAAREPQCRRQAVTAEPTSASTVVMDAP